MRLLWFALLFSTLHLSVQATECPIADTIVVGSPFDASTTEFHPLSLCDCESKLYLTNSTVNETRIVQHAFGRTVLTDSHMMPLDSSDETGTFQSNGIAEFTCSAWHFGPGSFVQIDHWDGMIESRHAEVALARNATLLNAGESSLIRVSTAHDSSKRSIIYRILCRS